MRAPRSDRLSHCSRGEMKVRGSNELAQCQPSPSPSPKPTPSPSPALRVRLPQQERRRGYAFQSFPLFRLSRCGKGRRLR